MAAEKPSRLDQRRAEFAQYKKDVKERGKPFFPYAMFHDTVMSLVVVCVIVGLAVIWKYTHLIGPLYAAKTIDLCAPGDDICSGVPNPQPGFAHLTYGTNGMTNDAAAFVVSHL